MEGFDFHAFLNQKYYATDFQTLMGEIRDYLDLSERTLEWQHRVEVHSIEQRQEVFVNPHDSQSYRDHLLENAQFRFEQALPIQVRYAALISLIISVDWYCARLKKWAKFKIQGDSPIDVIRAFCHKLSVNGDRVLSNLQNLITVRGFVVHRAGVSGASVRHGQPDPVDAVNALEGFRMVDWPWLGERVSIDRGALDSHLTDIAELLPKLVQLADESSLLRDD